jgi:hypothetical protein
LAAVWAGPRLLGRPDYAAAAVGWTRRACPIRPTSGADTRDGGGRKELPERHRGHRLMALNTSLVIAGDGASAEAALSNLDKGLRPPVRKPSGFRSPMRTRRSTGLPPPRRRQLRKQRKPRQHSRPARSQFNSTGRACSKRRRRYRWSKAATARR